MDVTCDRCSTEYEFDDALVSERGTSVKCTNCGHQFKVYRARSGALPDQWVVVADGGTTATHRPETSHAEPPGQSELSKHELDE